MGYLDALSAVPKHFTPINVCEIHRSSIPVLAVIVVGIWPNSLVDVDLIALEIWLDGASAHSSF